MEKLKQRRDERKKKAEDDKQKNNEPYDNKNIVDKSDAQFEKMMKKRKAEITDKSKPVNLLNKI